MTKRILITGVTGFVGAAVSRSFRAAGYQVRALIRDEAQQSALQAAGIETVIGDLNKPQIFPAALADCTHLAHVAADYRLFVPGDPSPMYRVNVDATLALLQAALAAGIERVVYTSSVAALGDRADHQPADETCAGRLQNMIGHYKRSKFLAEEAVRRLVADTGLPVVIVNPSTPVGPGDVKPTPTGCMVRDAARGRMPAYIDTGLNVVHVDDVAAGHRLALEHGRPGERYILGGDNLTLREILAIIAQHAGRRAPRIRLAPRPLVPLAWCAETWARLRRTQPLLSRDQLAMARRPMYYVSTRAERELGYTHRPAAMALHDAVAWFTATGAE
ncbi:MAG TPA: hopanoid-associated sugar epimerase [Salinisphaeraceae bacterium]|nr:hopanoid-associated sugar epimerase [Salinisphaeraceae bacterium]